MRATCVYAVQWTVANTRWIVAGIFQGQQVPDIRNLFGILITKAVFRAERALLYLADHGAIVAARLVIVGLLFGAVTTEPGWPD